MQHVILNLHGVGDPSRTLEPGEENYWITKKFFHDVLAMSEDLKELCLCRYTADDGNLSDIQTVAPALAHINQYAAFFVLTGRLNQTGSLDAASLRDLQQMGHEIGSHGHSHVPWTSLDDEGLKSEISEPKIRLSEITGHSIDKAGLPFGRYNRKVLLSLQQAGFMRCYSSDGGAAHPRGWPIHRTSLRADMTLDDVQNILLGNEHILQKISRRAKSAIKKRF